MKNVIISLKGHQYDIRQGDEIVVDFLNLDDGKKLSADKIVAVYGNGKIILEPKLLANYKVELEVLESKKGKKIRVFKYKSKSRYRLTKGFRPMESRLKVNRIIAKNG